MLAFGAWYQYANIVGYLGGSLISFFLNRIITFKAKDKITQRLAMFLGIAAIGFLISTLLLWILIDVVYLDPKFSKLLTLPIVVIIQFSLNRRLTFNEGKKNNFI